MYEQDKKWQKYKEYIVSTIQTNKKLKKGSPFDNVWRTPNMKFPKEVHFLPKSPMNAYSEGKKRKPANILKGAKEDY